MTQASQPTVTFTMGLPAAGKSTWVKANLPSYFVVDPDAIKESRNDYDPQDPATLHTWSKTVAAAQFATCLLEGINFVLDGTGTKAEALIQNIRTAAAAGYTTRLVYVTCALSTSLKRNAARARVVPEDVIREKSETIAIAFELVSREVDQIRVINN